MNAAYKTLKLKNWYLREYDRGPTVTKSAFFLDSIETTWLKYPRGLEFNHNTLRALGPFIEGVGRHHTERSLSFRGHFGAKTRPFIFFQYYSLLQQKLPIFNIKYHKTINLYSRTYSKIKHTSTTMYIFDKNYAK